MYLAASRSASIKSDLDGYEKPPAADLFVRIYRIGF
jgi:hypothetical protein